ncbi:Pentatricopeptide repeat-containing protein [Drosera capensis]
MYAIAAKASRAHRCVTCVPFIRVLSTHSGSSFQSRPFQDLIETTIASKSYQQIPSILSSWKGVLHDEKNPFSFLSKFSSKSRACVIDEVLRSLAHLRPRPQSYIGYELLLSYTLQSSEPFPIALVVLQQSLRAGCSPVPETQIILSSAWLYHRCRFQCVGEMFLDVESNGYRPDCGTCNYIISSLCAVDQLDDAIEVLRWMTGVACIPDLDSFSPMIVALCKERQTAEALEMMKEMVSKFRLSPRQGLLVKLTSSLRANKELWRAVEMIEFLEEKGFYVGFESYELVIEGCLEDAEFLLAGKISVRMVQKGFIPYIKVRQKVIEGLISAGEWHLACALRHRFAKLNS